MSSQMRTLHEIAVKYAKKQSGMVDSLTEDSPILERIKWKPSTHGMWNVAEKMTDIKGASFIEADAPLPYMHTSTDLVHTDLHVMGGTMEVPTLRAKKLGGPQRYFADRQGPLLKKSGMDTERQIVLHNWLRGAKAAKNLYNAGGTGEGWFILGVRFDELSNVGLYDPDQFDSGRLFKIDYPYGSDEHYLHGPGYEGVLGFSVVYRAIFGYQILDAARTVAAIVNVDEEHKPTPTMIDDMLATIRSQPGTTLLVTSPRGKIYGINPYKVENVQLVPTDKDAKTHLESWNGIPIVTSHNIAEKMPNVKV